MSTTDGELPKLPLPEIDGTLKRLRRSLEPIATDEEKSQLDELFLKAGAELVAPQDILQKRFMAEDNWVGKWWEEYAYLRNREPNVINTNTFSVRLVDFDEQTWRAAPMQQDPLARAALCIMESMHFRKVYLDGKLPQDTMAGVPQCMKPYKRYWSMRIPQQSGCDRIIETNPRDAKSVFVMFNGSCFFIQVIDEDDRELSFQEILMSLRYGTARCSTIRKDSSVGLLTTAPRDIAAKAFAELRENKSNANFLDRLNRCLTTVSIDPDPVNTVDEALLRAAHGYPHNRWYDRSNSQIIASNGVCMYQSDHAALDASANSTTPMDLATKYSEKILADGTCEIAARIEFEPNLVCDIVHWELTHSLRETMRKALDKHRVAAATAEVRSLRFKTLGRKKLRSWGVAADAFMQIALQLAYFRLNGTVTPVYESASTRSFESGRTETIRSLTSEMKDLVSTFKQLDLKEAAKKISAVSDRHKEVLRDASSGQGIDRHLLGLKIAQSRLPGSPPLPALFSHAAVQRSHKFGLVTSQMTGKTFLGGFAHSAPEGYGLCYYIHGDEIMGIVSCNSVQGKTSTKGYLRAVYQAMEDLTFVCENSFPLKPDSKL